MVAESGLARVLCDSRGDSQILPGNCSQVRLLCLSVWRVFFPSDRGRFGLLKYIHLEHEVIRAEWDAQVHKWRLRVRGPNGKEFDDDCDVFINAGGTPILLGLDEFRVIIENRRSQRMEVA